MKKQDIRELADQLASVVLDAETLPVRTSNVCTWQDFAVVSDADAAYLDTIGIAARGTIYESGVAQLTITIRPDKLEEKLKEKVKDAYKSLKAKNLVLIAIEQARKAKIAEDESAELLVKAADMLGITPKQALEMVNKSEAKQ